MTVTWKFASTSQMATFMRKEAEELRLRSKKPSMSKSDAKALMHEAHGWSQAAMIVENCLIEEDNPMTSLAAVSVRENVRDDTTDKTDD